MSAPMATKELPSRPAGLEQVADVQDPRRAFARVAWSQGERQPRSRGCRLAAPQMSAASVERPDPLAWRGTSLLPVASPCIKWYCAN